MLAGTTVSADGVPLPLFYVSDTQINAQLLNDAYGDSALEITTAGGSARTPITVADSAPAIFSNGILHLNGTPVGSASPARPGETLIIFATGLGPVDRPLPAGQPAPLSPLARTVGQVVVEIGDIRLSPMFAGLTPGFAGVYQVNVGIPADLPLRSYSLRLAVNGTVSNSAVVLLAR